MVSGDDDLCNECQNKADVSNKATCQCMKSSSQDTFKNEKFKCR